MKELTSALVPAVFQHRVSSVRMAQDVLGWDHFYPGSLVL